MGYSAARIRGVEPHEQPFPELDLEGLIGLTPQEAADKAEAAGVGRVRFIDVGNEGEAIDMVLPRPPARSPIRHFRQLQTCFVCTWSEGHGHLARNRRKVHWLQLKIQASGFSRGQHLEILDNKSQPERLIMKGCEC